MNRFEKFAAFLREAVPLENKVVIRRVAMGDEGSTSMSDRRTITICIRKDAPIATQIDILIHEWGHAYEYDKTRNHGETWGRGMSKAYEAWEEFRDNEN